MSRIHRILVEVLAPPLLASALVLATGHNSYGVGEILIGIPVFVFAAYAFAILPCVGYALLMEFWFAKGLASRCGLVCTATMSAAFGAVSGLLIHLLIPGGAMNLVPIGALDGLVVGSGLAWFARPRGSSV
jgi:hypothetical protein